jgi:hypothetical protein
MLRACLGAFAAVAIVLAAACDSSPGKIRGDMYLVEDLDKETSLSGATVRLVWEGERFSTQIDSALGRICPTRGDPTPSAAEWEAARQARARILQAATRQTTVSDARARFAFDSVPPGRYRLWADTVVGTTRWTWLHRVRVNPGDSVEADLSNANNDDNPFRCLDF